MASKNNTPPNINTDANNTEPEYIDTPAKFDITTFPNASRIKIDTNTKKIPRRNVPNQPLRSLNNIPQQMAIIPDDVETVKMRTESTDIKPAKYNYLNPSNRHKILRYIATSLAIVVALLLFAAIFMDNTANAKYCIEDNCGTYSCSWTGMSFNDGVNSSQYTKQYGGALICLNCISVSILFIIVGIIYVQPYKIQKRICIPVQFARIFFVIAFILLLTSIVVFVFGDAICYANTSIDIHFTLAPSIILDILSVCIVFCVLFIAM